MNNFVSPSSYPSLSLSLSLLPALVCLSLNLLLLAPRSAHTISLSLRLSVSLVSLSLAMTILLAHLPRRMHHPERLLVLRRELPIGGVWGMRLMTMRQITFCSLDLLSFPALSIRSLSLSLSLLYPVFHRTLFR